MENFLYNLLLVFICFTFWTKVNAVEDSEGYTKIESCRYLKVLEYKGHTYIYLRNTWSGAGDQLLHDPGCKCKKEG